MAELNVLTASAPPFPLISQANWTLSGADSQETAAGNYAATNAFDGNSAHVVDDAVVGCVSTSATRDPDRSWQHLRRPRISGTFRARMASRTETLGRTEFYVSTDGVNWESAVASGTMPNTAAEQQVLFTAKAGRYVRLRALTEISGGPWTVVAELNVLGTGNQPPNGVIGSPASDVTIALGGSVTFSGNGSDPENHVPLTYSWNFGAGGPGKSNEASTPEQSCFPMPGCTL